MTKKPIVALKDRLRKHIQRMKAQQRAEEEAVKKKLQAGLARARKALKQRIRDKGPFKPYTPHPTAKPTYKLKSLKALKNYIARIRTKRRAEEQDLKEQHRKELKRVRKNLTKRLLASQLFKRYQKSLLEEKSKRKPVSVKKPKAKLKTKPKVRTKRIRAMKRTARVAGQQGQLPMLAKRFTKRYRTRTRRKKAEPPPTSQPQERAIESQAPITVTIDGELSISSDTRRRTVSATLSPVQAGEFLRLSESNPDEALRYFFEDVYGAPGMRVHHATITIDEKK